MKKSFFLLLGFIYFSLVGNALTVDYTLGMSKPNSHYFEVEMEVTDVNADHIVVKMPVWAPGSYLIREFSKNVNLVQATDQSGKNLTVKKITKNAWKINTADAKSVKINYNVYAFELSVRTSFLDDAHGYVSGPSVFMYVDGAKNAAGKLHIKPHQTFKKIATALELEKGTTYRYEDYDQLVDCPIEMGNHVEFQFNAAGVNHTVAMYGEGNYDIPTLKRDMAKVIEAETLIMGENPNKEYVFIIHNITNASGGLEHRNSTTLDVNRWTYSEKDYLGFISLVAHEYFHLWNVKRMRPKSLGPFDYDSENYTDLLWVMEGFTSYYDELVLRRAGFYTEDDYVAKLFGTMNYVENQPGNKVQPVAHASFDAWIKAYRPNENSANSTISYYSKGQLLAAMLDLYIINKFKAEKSLDNFLQSLYNSYFKQKNIGFTEDEFQLGLEDFLGEDMDWFFDKYVYGTHVIDYKAFFAGVGLEVADKPTNPTPDLGIRTNESNGKVLITTVYAGSAAEEQGLSVNDEILAMNGYRVNKAELETQLGTIKPGDDFELMISRDNIIKSYPLKMGENNSYHFSYSPKFDEKTRAQFNYWLRVDIH